MIRALNYCYEKALNFEMISSYMVTLLDYHEYLKNVSQRSFFQLKDLGKLKKSIEYPRDIKIEMKLHYNVFKLSSKFLSGWKSQSFYYLKFKSDKAIW